MTTAIHRPVRPSAMRPGSPAHRRASLSDHGPAHRGADTFRQCEYPRRSQRSQGPSRRSSGARGATVVHSRRARVIHRTDGEGCRDVASPGSMTGMSATATPGQSPAAGDADEPASIEAASSTDALGAAGSADALGSAHAQARTRAENGDLTGARTLLEDALAAGEVRFGHDHPRLAPLMVDLATIARGLGNLTEALTQLRRAYAIIVSSGGPEHPTALSIEGRLAAVMHRLGEPTEAYDWHIADVGTRVLGSEHPAVRGAQQRLAEAPAEPPPDLFPIATGRAVVPEHPWEPDEPEPGLAPTYGTSYVRRAATRSPRIRRMRPGSTSSARRRGSTRRSRSGRSRRSTTSPGAGGGAATAAASPSSPRSARRSSSRRSSSGAQFVRSTTTATAPPRRLSEPTPTATTPPAPLGRDDRRQRRFGHSDLGRSERRQGAVHRGRRAQRRDLHPAGEGPTGPHDLDDLRAQLRLRLLLHRGRDLVGRDRSLPVFGPVPTGQQLQGRRRFPTAESTAYDGRRLGVGADARG